MKKVILALALVGVLAAPASAQFADAVDLHTCTVHAAPSDVADWGVQYPITQVTVSPSAGIKIASPALAQWPDSPFGDGGGGTIQYTVWVGIRFEGQCHVSGFIQMWRGRMNDPGHSIPAFLSSDPDQGWHNYAYDARWSPMDQYIPKAGDIVYFFLTQGNERGGSITATRTRTNVVAIHYPANDSGSFDFSATPVPTPDPVPVPTPTPVPVPVPQPVPVTDLGPILSRLDLISAQLAATSQQLTQTTKTLEDAINEPAWFTKLAENKYVQMVGAAVATYFTTKKLGQ